MKTKLITILLFIITLSISCNEESKLGIDFLPNDDLLNFTIIDTSTVIVSTVLDDSLVTENPSKFLLGVYLDPIFGKTKAEFGTQVITNSNSSILPSYFDGVAHSLTVFLALDTLNKENFYGNKTDSLKINVYKLKKIISTTDDFYSNDSPELYKSDELLGSVSFSPNSDKVITIPLKYEFAQELIDRADYYFDTDDTLYFQEVFYGLYFSIVDNNNNSVLARISPSQSETKMELKYIPVGSLNDSIYTYNFLMNTSCVSFNLFSHDYENTVIENVVSENPTIDSVAYLQSMGGTRIKVEFPYLKNLKKDRLIVNKAELVVKAENSDLTLEGLYRAHEYIAMVGYNTSNQLFLLNEYLNTSIYTGASYENGEYHFILTNQVQEIINNGNYSYDFYLIGLQRKYNFERTIVTTGKHTNPMRLIITYTQY